MIDVTYRKPERADQPKVIASVTLKQSHVPRIGEFVSIHYRRDGVETFSGYVRTVDWKVNFITHETSVTVNVD